MRGPDLPAVSGIVLAGGRSSRFGRDKLAEPVDGTPLLERAMAGIAPVVTELVVAGPSTTLVSHLSIRVQAVPDPEPDGGPLVGVLAGLEVVAEPITLVVAGDMPRLSADVLGLLVRTLTTATSEEVDAVVLAFGGRIQPVPIAVRTGAGTDAARRGLERGARSLYAWLDGLRVHAVPEATWRALDPEAQTLLDVDRAEDLDRLEG